MLPELELPCRARRALAARGQSDDVAAPTTYCSLNVNTPTDLVVATSRALDDGLGDRPVLTPDDDRVRRTLATDFWATALWAARQAAQRGGVHRCRRRERSDEALAGHAARLARALRRPRGSGARGRPHGSNAGPMPARSPRSSVPMRITTSATPRAPCGRRSTSSKGSRRRRRRRLGLDRPSRSCGAAAPDLTPSSAIPRPGLRYGRARASCCSPSRPRCSSPAAATTLGETTTSTAADTTSVRVYFLRDGKVWPVRDASRECRFADRCTTEPCSTVRPSRRAGHRVSRREVAETA